MSGVNIQAPVERVDDTAADEAPAGFVPLRKEIRAHGEMVSGLTLRPPTTEEIMDIGQPFLIIVGDGETGIRIQMKIIGAWIVKLAGIPLSSVKSMDPADFGKAQAVVLGFFGDAASAQELS